MLSSCHTKVPVLISIIYDEVPFHHTWICTCFTTASQMYVQDDFQDDYEMVIVY